MTILIHLDFSENCSYETAYQYVSKILADRFPVACCAYDTRDENTIGVDIDFEGSKWMDQKLPMLDVWGRIASTLIFSGITGIKFEVVA